ncbi:MAG: hypothetical protein EPO22_15180 [Dehalococcoidia bacterium]|nr:MAG: hypothetical protein EPO22_15180 [Dehalococcoidia bacterium]
MTTTADSGAGSLRQAILDANGTPGSDLITFAISPGGPQTIAPVSALPAITDSVTIDATSQPGFSGTPLIELNGANAGSTTDGLLVTGGAAAISGLVINRFSSNGIELAGSSTGSAVTGCYIGTNVAGSAASANGNAGVLLHATSGNAIGGTTQAERNVVSGNTGPGIQLTGLGASGNTIAGNYIGVTASGAAALGNNRGVYIDAGSNNTIGGMSGGARNVISGNVEGIGIGGSNNSVLGNYIGTNATGTAALKNAATGVAVFFGGQQNVIGGADAGAGNLISGNGVGVWVAQSGALGNTVQGNLIGTDVTGMLAVGNTDRGVLVYTSNNTIGGRTPAARNVISGNGQGVDIEGGTDQAKGNVVQGNYIGTNITGTAAVPNTGRGVVIFGESGNFIGGASPDAGNLVSGNASSGVEILSSGGNQIQGNLIGTDVTGHLALPNGGSGVLLFSGTNTIVGGTAPGARNVISGNAQNGVTVTYFTTGAQVQGNYVGVDVSGDHELPNGGHGVLIGGGVFSASNNTVGGTAAGAGNVISGNAGSGVAMQVSGTTGNVVQQNRIGTNAAGLVAIPNGADGVSLMTNVGGNTVGGVLAGAGNLISVNGAHGIEISGSVATANNVVQGNLVGTDASGTAPLANAMDGVRISVGVNNTIGGAAPLARNVISGNGMNGIEILDTTSPGNNVQGNFVGTDAGGVGAIPNASAGIRLSNATHNTIGGTAEALRNTISGNGSNGVEIVDTASPGNVVEGNFIGTDVTGNLALANAGAGIAVGGAIAATIGNTIGGVDAGAYNVISGNGQAGIDVSANSQQTAILANLIGGRFDFIGPLPNGADGVLIHGGATGTLVAANVIAGNSANGVRVDGSSAATSGNPIRVNSIFLNALKGIANVAGGNLGLARPIITSVNTRSYVEGTACANCTIDLFTDFEDEGGDFQAAVTADSGGHWSWAGSITGGWYVTATATDSYGDTSEFSLRLAIDADDDGCADAGEDRLGLDPLNKWDFYSVPVPALFATPGQHLVFRDNIVGASDAQAVFAYFMKGAKAGSAEYEQDLNGNGIKDGLEYDRSFAGPARSGTADGVIAASDAQLAFAQFTLGYKC